MAQSDEVHTTLKEWVAQYLRAKQAEKLSRFTLAFYRQQINQVEAITPNLVREFMLSHE